MIPLGVLASARVAAVSGYDSLVLASSPAAYWRLNEASGASTAIDRSGNSRNLSYLAGRQSGAAMGSGLSTSSTGRIVGTYSIEWLDGLSSTFTVEMVAQLTGTVGGWVDLVAFRTLGWSVNTGPEGTSIQFAFHHGQWRDAIYSGFGTSARHIVAVLDPSGHRLYVDGALAGEVVRDNEILSGSQDIFVIGLDTQALISDVAIYPTALSPSTIAAHYAAAGI